MKGIWIECGGGSGDYIMFATLLIATLLLIPSVTAIESTTITNFPDSISIDKLYPSSVTINQVLDITT
ncbi:hypothetical protein L1887_37038 [Cichorium endivia]|nr:hypothetical protein L1887_37038 [Cichorium endivia]